MLSFGKRDQNPKWPPKYFEKSKTYFYKCIWDTEVNTLLGFEAWKYPAAILKNIIYFDLP